MSKVPHFWILWLIKAVIFALLLKILFDIKFVNTALVVSGWVFIGHLITIDDDFSGGWSNPFGVEEFPYGELLMKALVFGAFIFLKIWSNAE